MSDEISIEVDIPKDENGMLGRECLECERYFKLKPGTGLPTDYCHCPYCEYEGSADTFWTPAQLEYAKSVALNNVYEKILRPALDDLTKSFKDLERKTRNSFIQFKVTKDNFASKLPISYYNEEELETQVTCNSCGLEFAVYGVFARCPDCKNLNAFLIFSKSIDTAQKKLDIFLKPDISAEIKEDSFKHIISDCISAFDALGKELRRIRPELFHSRIKNLFQNFYALNETLDGLLQQQHSNFDFVLKMFQVRHLYEHNLGVIDEDFVKKIPGYEKEIGKKYTLTSSEAQHFIVSMLELKSIIENYFDQDNS
ncbi:hypothetical protein [Salinispira pacifica]|uniref:Uncharacterized protein n=1 Tax=Salinispira pacifica TaxID=1307761 RepID=V5WIK4_9SPIO|nr:hypothetical protein [Salinispira pacifica]AHC15455.1 hypothetical protein L21SP2_2088 [Salinispira pacifica]